MSDIRQEGHKTRSSFTAGFWLVSAIPISGIAIFLVESFVHRARFQEIVGLPFLIIIFSGSGYMWARSLLKRSAAANLAIQSISGAIAFPAMIAVGYIGFDLIFGSTLEFLGIQQTTDGTHSEFIVIFVIWTAIVTGGCGFALGISQKNWKLGFKLLAVGVLVGGITFLITVKVMEIFGFWVGIPREDGLPSMPIITMLGILLAALIGSELFGRLLSSSAKAEIE